MKTKLLPPLLLLTLSLSLFSSCQKGGSDSKPAATNPDAKTTADNAAIPTTVCSEALKKLITEFSENQKQIASLFDQIKDKKSSSTLNDEYRLKGEKQVENCRLIEEKFDREKAVACLKTDAPKTKENSIYKSTFTTNCKSIGLWAKKISQKDNRYTQTESLPQMSDFTFKPNATALINTGETADVIFIVNGAVKNGKDKFKQSVQDGLITCLMTTQIMKPSDDLKYKYVTDTNDSTPPTDIGFEFNGNRSVIVLQDSNSAIHSMLCLNLKLSSEKDKKSILQKVFGLAIQISEKDSSKKITTEIVSQETAKALLNQDVAPAPETQGAIATPPTPTTPTSGPTKLDPEAIQKQFAEGATMVANQVKEVTDHGVDKLSAAASKNIAEVQAAGDELLEKTKATSHAIVKDAVNEAKQGVIDLVKAPFVSAKETMVEFLDDHVFPTVHSVMSWFSSDDKQTSDAKPSAASKMYSEVFDTPLERAKKENAAKTAAAKQTQTK